MGVPKRLSDTITDTAEFVMSVSSVAGLRVGGIPALAYLVHRSVPLTESRCPGALTTICLRVPLRVVSVPT
jgi:hypothetical protein